MVKKGNLKFFTNLTPLIPLSLERRGGKKKKRGAKPLFYAH